jgi:AcrR family transcriptional regulator
MVDTGKVPNKRSKRGRVPAAEVEERKARILESAATVFLEAGFSGATMTAIAKLAGCSLETLYHLYPTKSELFAGVVQGLCGSFFIIMGELSSDRDLNEALGNYASELLAVVTKRENRELHRLVIAEHLTFPELGQVFWDAGPARGFTVLEHYFSSKKSRGEIRCSNPRRAAEMFISLLLNGVTLRQNLGIPSNLEEPKQRAAWARYVTNLFLNMLEHGLL